MDMQAATRTGAVLSHVETHYRPGERQMAIDLFQALGCATVDTGMTSGAGSTYISVHTDPGERGEDNVIYLCEMPAEQARLDEALRRRIETDAELRALRDGFRELAAARPFDLSHVAVRYPSFESLERVLEGLEARLTPELKPRVTLKVFRPGEFAELESVGIESLQAFVYTDVAASGVSAFGQIFELGAYRPISG
jgi:hypothetical protein